MRKIILFLLLLIFISGCVKQVTTPDEVIDEQPTEQPTIPEGKTVEDIPDFMLKQECTKYSWPPSCSMVPHAEGKKLCEKCKNFKNGEDFPIDDLPQEKGLAEMDLPAECRGQRWPPSCDSVTDEQGKILCVTCTDIEKKILNSQAETEEISLEYFKNKKRFVPNLDYARKNIGTWYTEKDREAVKKLMTRNYPAEIKSLLEPSQPYQTQVLDEEIENVKALGVNTMTIFVQYDYGNDKYILIHPEGQFYSEKDAENEIINWIIKAKSNGFAVDLTVITGNPTEEIEGDNLPLFLEQTKETRLKWAKVAEEYKVEYYTPYSEFVGEYYLIMSGTRPETVPTNVYIEYNQWLREQIPELRGIFSGKLIWKVAELLPDGTSAEGFDYFGVDFSPNPDLPISDFEIFADENLNHMIEVAERDNVDWIVGEFWVHHSCLGGDALGTEVYCPHKKVGEQQTADYYQIVLEKYYSIQDSRKKGFVFDAYVFPAQKIKGTPAEAIVKEYFSIGK